MSEENKCNADFDKVVTEVKNLPGGVKAFILVALAAEKDDRGHQIVNAMAGKRVDISLLAMKSGDFVLKDLFKTTNDFCNINNEERKNDE